MNKSQQLPFARRKSAIAATTLLASFATTTSVAQTAPAQGEELEEIVVTGFR